MVWMIVAILGREVGFEITWHEVDSRAVGIVVQQTNDMLGLEEWKGYAADPGNLCKVGQV